MKMRLNVTGMLVALVVIATLACSPQMILGEWVGGKATGTPTKFAQAANTPVSSSTLISPIPTATFSPSLTPTPGITNTPSPVLALRTDLPSLTLRDWPRPANDNGRCIHFLPTGYYSQRDFDIQIPRMVDLQMRWVLALYADENQLRLAARNFKAAGIVPIWRKTLDANQRYYGWGRDVQILTEVGLPPYFQIYNEPDTDHEWNGSEVNREQWVAYFVQMAKDVYNAGGFVGLQTLDEEWIRTVLQAIKAYKGERMTSRMFFIPHPYGLNHPPNYIEDDNGVLGWRGAAEVFQQELGFVPPFIAGEGGWKFAAGEDNRFPSIDNKLHAQYHVELFRWFVDGKVSDSKALPDYFFAFCPWILAGQLEGAAWYDSFEGERTQTIADIKKIPIVTRKFSWDKK